MKYRSSLLFLALLFSCFSPLAAAREPIYESQRVGQIEVCFANAEVSPADAEGIRSRLTTRIGRGFSQIEFDTDLKMLAKEYDRVDPSLSIEGESLNVKLLIWVRPTIRSVNWVGCKSVKESRLQRELGVPVGSTYDRRSFNKAFNQLKTYYISRGYFEAELSYRTVPDNSGACVDIEVSINEGRSGRIRKLIFENFTSQEEKEIAEQLVTKKYNLFMSWLSGEGNYNKEAIQQDQLAIINYLQNKGYADAKVTITACEAANNAKNRIDVHIHADKGACYQFANVSFEGNCLLSNDDICRQLIICPGTRYSPDEIRECARRIMDCYGRRGYIDTVVDYEIRLEEKECAFSVHFKIEEGEKYYVGMIKVFGNCTTDTNVILHETMLVPGKVFNTDLLKLTELRLHNIGFFKNVNVYSVKSEGPFGLGDCYRDVHIEVEETTTGSIGAFFGFSSAESIFGGVNITENNFSYKGLTRFWQDGYHTLRGGGEYAYLTTQIGAKNRSYTLSWTKPYVCDTKWSVGFDINHTNNGYLSKDYTVHSTGYTLRGNYRINPRLRFGTHYRITNAKVTLSGSSNQCFTIGDNEFKMQIDDDGMAQVYKKHYISDAEKKNYHPDKIKASSRKPDAPYVLEFVDKDEMKQYTKEEAERQTGIRTAIAQATQAAAAGKQETAAERENRERRQEAFDKLKKEGKLKEVDLTTYTNDLLYKNVEQAQGNAELKSDAQNDGLISAVGMSLIYDTTDHPQTPRSGFKSRFDSEIAGVGGDHTFFSFSLLNSYYFPIGERGVIRYRCDFRFIVPFGETTYSNMPIDERLFLGGDTTIRGYRAYRIGPLYTGTDDPRGGLSLQLYSIEYVHKIFDRLDAFVFLDAGELSRDIVAFREPRAAIGFGVNLGIFPNAPPLTFGMGFPINRDNDSQVKKFFFTLGGAF